MKYIAILLFLISTSLPAESGEIELKVKFCIKRFDIDFSNPNVRVEAGNTEMEFLSPSRIDISIGAVDFDSANDDWLVTKKEKFDIDWSNMYNE